jgi:transposase-like protein
MYLSGISVRKIAGVTEALSRVKVGKDTVSRIASRLEQKQRGVGAQALPYDGRPPRSRETKPTTFETLT